jgi:hypothetical protein
MVWGRYCSRMRSSALIASAETVGSSMPVVDALNERAAAFYESFGFQPLPESLRLVLPMRSIEEVLVR